jgi:hypothetical protein
MPRRLFAFASFAIVATFAYVATAAPSKAECVAANSSAQDLRRAGKLRAAREKLVTCVDSACPGPVREDCAERLQEIDKVAPSVVFDAKDSIGNDLSAVVVTMDGEPLAEKLDGSALPVDPGKHTFRFESRGVKTEKTLLIHEGEKDRRERIALGDTIQAHNDSSPSRVPAIVAFGVGGVGLIVGIAFTGLWASDKSAGDKACGSNGELVGKTADCANQQAADGWSGRQAGDTAGLVIGFIIAAAGAAVGAVLLVTSTSSSDARSSGTRSRIHVGAGGILWSF